MYHRKVALSSEQLFMKTERGERLFHIPIIFNTSKLIYFQYICRISKCPILREKTTKFSIRILKSWMAWRYESFHYNEILCFGRAFPSAHWDRICTIPLRVKIVTSKKVWLLYVKIQSNALIWKFLKSDVLPISPRLIHCSLGTVRGRFVMMM